MATPRKSARVPAVKEAAAASAPLQPTAVEAVAASASVTAPALESAAVLEAAAAQLGDIREMLRQASAASLEQSRAAYARVKDAAEELSASIERAYKASGEGAEALRVHAVDALKANSDASFEYARAAAAARSLPDLVNLQADFARKQSEIFGVQAREFAHLVEKVANDAMQPLKSVLGKGFGAAA